ncbi:MAG: hypothetical protein AAF485_05785 [Chloroflexota bacterium]
MLIEIGTPGCLPLGLVKFEDEAGPRTCLLGLTVQHPPIQVFAQAYSGLQVTGPRADLGYSQAETFLQHHSLPRTGEVEIESTIPNLVGLGSDILQGLSVAKALAWLHTIPEEAQTTPSLAQGLGLTASHSLDMWASDQGGLLLIDLEHKDENGFHPIIRRHEVSHAERFAWAFVFLFPDDTDTISETFEAERREALFSSIPHLSGETGELFDKILWPAVENDDYDAFAQSLMKIHQLNEAALAQAGSSVDISEENQALLNLMEETGADAWGQNLWGYSFYGLIKGGDASRNLRKVLRKQVGFFGGTILATIADNRGLQAAVDEDRNIHDGRLKPVTNLNLG